jgi:acetylornithine deacetylase/succinyl-diaminopimelate desuccinylase-like protein
MPSIADNALVKAAPLIERAAAFRPAPRIEPEIAAFMRLLVGRDVHADEALTVAREAHPLAAELIEPLLGPTVSPTMISASQKRNVVPAVCELICDCRLLPGQTQAEAEALLRDALGPDGYDFEWLEGQGGTRSPIESPLWDAMESVIGDDDPGARLAPICLAGFTDSHWLREAFGTVAYGFFPMRAMDPELAARLVHSADERCAVDDLELGVCARPLAACSSRRAKVPTWQTRRSDSAAWHSQTACSCTGRAPGRARSARPTGSSSWSPTTSGFALPRSDGRFCAVPRALPR